MLTIFRFQCQEGVGRWIARSGPSSSPLQSSEAGGGSTPHQKLEVRVPPLGWAVYVLTTCPFHKTSSTRAVQAG